MKAIPILWLVE